MECEGWEKLEKAGKAISQLLVVGELIHQIEKSPTVVEKRDGEYVSLHNCRLTEAQAAIVWHLLKKEESRITLENSKEITALSGGQA